MEAGSLLDLFIAALYSIARHVSAKKWPWQKPVITWDWESVLRFLGIRLGDIPTTVVRDGAVTVDALVRRADAFSDRPAGGGATTIISGGRLQIITTVPHGPHWVALRRNLTSEAFHPVRGLARATPHRERALAGLVADVASRSCSGDGVVPVRDCLYAALFKLNVATCFGDGVVDCEQVEAMRVAQREFLHILPTFRVFATFQKVAKLLYWDRWKQLVHSRRKQEEMYLPLIRARQEQRRRTGDTTATSYVDTLLDLEVPAEGDPHQKRNLNDGEMVGLVSEYLGASTGTVLALLEWTLANLVLQPGVQTRLRREVEAAGGEACAYLRAVVMEALRRHPPVPAVQRHMSSDVVVGTTPVDRGTLVNFSLEDIGRDSKIWTSPEDFIPDRFMPGGEGAGVRLTVGSKEATKVKMMPFGAGRRICPGMGYAMVNLEYFLAKLVTAFEWHPVKGEEEVDLTAEHGFFTTMLNPLRAQVVPRTTSLQTTA
ncbi:hypothetical protein PR202_gb01561 [Eleusine coracana subsp. coracana]|uniref:Cytochrome P450 89A2 n=1 Tax=Eleusine coracana subsp. coracana TaxID=191504 RepID=A0AAV5DWY8_ELECO|nr:hypothetical protein QOZ80_5BG0417120 [Eleusine coracana subsp. coracana]GJN14706.1 hypothetical protein PR202_gb01561 [Eleusine coracana subsp. coracana]